MLKTSLPAPKRGLFEEGMSVCPRRPWRAVSTRGMRQRQQLRCFQFAAMNLDQAEGIVFGIRVYQGEVRSLDSPLKQNRIFHGDRFMVPSLVAFAGD